MASAASQRSAKVSRKTTETDISVSVDVDGSGLSEFTTGVGFFDHMLDQLSRHSLIDMTVKAKGDLHIDDHHTVEDVGIALGQARDLALGEQNGIRAMPRSTWRWTRRWRVRRSTCRPGRSWSGISLPLAENRHFRHRTGARIFPGSPRSMPASPCIWPTTMAPTTTTSPRPPSRPWRVRCAQRSNDAPRQPDAVSLHQGDR